MSKETGEPREQSWVEAELEDSFDEELEMEIDDERIAKELRMITDLRHESALERRFYFHELFRLQAELVKLQDWVVQTSYKLVVIFEGRDAAGKGGVIKRITQRLNPRVCRVVALPAPTEREKSQWYFQRYVPHLPAGGEIVLFDRSWYNRAGVERVMGFATDDQVEAFFNDVPDYDPKTLIQRNMDAQSTLGSLRRARDEIASAASFDHESLEALLRAVGAELGLSARQFFGVLRTAVTGRTAAPPLFETMEVLGRDLVVRRLESAAERLDHVSQTEEL